MKFFFIKFIRFYQLYISPLFPSSCRYYPNCSEYSVWQFKHNSFLKALIATFFRIIRCNQLFQGGIDYPVIKKSIAPFNVFSKYKVVEPKFWFIPYKKNSYYIVKSVKTKEK